MALQLADDGEFTTETREASPVHLLIKIESFSLLSEHGIQKYESREFVAGGYKWSLIIYPDGHGPKSKGEYISVYLSMAETSSLPPDCAVDAIFCIFLYDQILGNYLCFRGKARRFDAMISSQWGFSKLISKKNLTDPSNGYLVDDKCVFGAEVFVIKSQRVIECVSLMNVRNPCKRDWKISQFSKLQGVWKSEEFSAGGHWWKLVLYPNGNGTGKGCYVSSYLECVDAKSFAPHQKIRANFCIRIKNKSNLADHYANLSSWFRSSSPDWGLPEFISGANMRDPFKGFVVDDCCYLEVEISVQAVVGDAPKLK